MDAQPQPFRIGLIAALRDELAATVPLTGTALPARPLTVGGLCATWSGPGPAACERAVEELLQCGCGALLSIGVCGGLSDGLASGRLVVPASVHTTEGEVIDADARWHAAVCRDLGARHPAAGILVQCDEAVTAVADKRELAHQTGACAVDLESGTVAAMAERAGLPWLALRVVVDPVATSVPSASLAGLRRDGTTRALPVVGALARRPWQLPALIRLGRRYRRALRELATAVPSATASANATCEAA